MPRQPNILLIMSDQHNKAVMGCAGDAAARTPALDRLAGEGMRFSEFSANAPLCVPSRMSFLTGRLPSENRVWHNQALLDSSIPTWAHALTLAGYETALIGRMHFEGPDQRHGFALRPCGEPFAIHPGAGQSMDALYLPGIPPHSGQNRIVMESSGTGKGAYEVADEDITEAALQYIREVSRAPARRPFAAVVGFLLPHCPFIGDPQASEYYKRALPPPRFVPQSPDCLPGSVQRYLKRRGLLEPLPEQHVRGSRAAYYAMVQSMDRLIGRTLDELEQSGLAENTLVIYTSDHGEMAGEHGCWTKSCFYEGSVGVPFIARLPGFVPAGTVSGHVASLADLGPTFAQLAGAEAPRGDGKPILRALRGEESGRGEAFSELCDPQDSVPGRMLRQGQWKIWEFLGDEAPALFDLERDPGEETDLGSDPSHAELRERLLARLREGWDPASVQKAALKQLEDYRYLSRWGGQVRPVLPDMTRLDISRESYSSVGRNAG